MLESNRTEWERPIRELIESNSDVGLGDQIIGFLTRRPPPAESLSIEFQRRFVDSVYLELPVFLKNATVLSESTPLREIKLLIRRGFGRSSAFNQLSDCPQLARLSSLELGVMRVLPQEITRLAASPHLGRLKELHFNSSSGLDMAAMEAICDSPLMPRLEKLKIYAQGDLGDLGVRTLVMSPAVRNLKSLTLKSCGITHEGLAFVVHPDRGPLEKLDLTSNPLTDAASPLLRDMRPIERLELSNTMLSDFGRRRTGSLARPQWRHIPRLGRKHDSRLRRDGPD